MIDAKLLEILGCPACDERPPVRPKDGKLLCEKCGRLYPMRDGIPVMLVEEAAMEDEQ